VIADDREGRGEREEADDEPRRLLRGEVPAQPEDDRESDAAQRGDGRKQGRIRAGSEAAAGAV
jgi:hypothetical protein